MCLLQHVCERMGLGISVRVLCPVLACTEGCAVCCAEGLGCSMSSSNWRSCPAPRHWNYKKHALRVVCVCV